MDNRMNQIITKTPYEWCLELNIRILDLENWPLKWYGSSERHYHTFSYISKSEFLNALKVCKVKYKSRPRKTDMYLEYRMYGIVPYNISDIQKGIQYGHGVVEYMLNVKGIQPHEEIFNKWAKEDKTFIILNGGTTNEDINNKWYGSLQQHRDSIQEMGIMCGEFKEPDLNDSLSAVVFLVDERVYDRVSYPNFVEEVLPYSKKKYSEKDLLALANRNEENYKKWCEKIGGKKNAFLRNFLRDFKLA